MGTSGPHSFIDLAPGSLPPLTDDIVLYDSPDPLQREAISREDFLELPLYDDNNEQQRVFNETGWEVPRRRARYLRSTIPFGCLVNLSRIHELFAPPADEDQVDGAVGTKFQVYPQAGLVSCGHVVAQDLMYPYNTFLANLNESLSQSEAEGGDTLTIDSQIPAVVGIASQMYNSVMHQTRGNSTQHHGVVLGNVTAALAGYWARNTPLAPKAERFKRKCDVQLPHQEFLHKITGRPLSRDLRVENVIGISMSGIHPTNPARRNGRLSSCFE